MKERLNPAQRNAIRMREMVTGVREGFRLSEEARKSYRCTDCGRPEPEMEWAIEGKLLRDFYPIPIKLGRRATEALMKRARKHRISLEEETADFILRQLREEKLVP